MSRRFAFRFYYVIAIAICAQIISGCTDEKIVFKDRELFTPVPSAANGFVGYTDTTAKVVVCGNCHVSFQDRWETTKHAHAWQTLQESGQAQALCENCHSVNQRGNIATTPGGYENVKDARYHDVQCESCHGPGLSHIQNPDATQPLAPVAVDTSLTRGCGECHNGAHHPFVDEWRKSPHATVVTSAAGNASCVQCHRGQGILAAWNVKSDYIEKNSPEHLAITCAVCHDPHERDVEGQLRFTVNTPRIEEHLCARCHNRRTNPDPTTAKGLEPHAPESALLVGDAGWFAPGSEISPGQIRATHGSEKNPKLCATCHVNKFTVTDKLTGKFVFQSTGHLFTAVPCLDAQGIPQPGDCSFSSTTRSFKGCTGSNCHGTEQVAASALATVTLRLQDVASQLESQLRKVDPNLDAAGGEIDPTKVTFTVAEGAFFNLMLARHGNTHTQSQYNYAAAATHNPFLVESLLRASIAEVQRTYNVTPNTTASQRISLVHE